MSEDKKKPLDPPVDNDVADNYDRLHVERDVPYEDLADLAEDMGDKGLAAHLRARAHGGGSDRRAPERLSLDAKKLDPYGVSPGNSTLGHKADEDPAKVAAEAKKDARAEAKKVREEEAKKAEEEAGTASAPSITGIHKPGDPIDKAPGAETKPQARRSPGHETT